MSRTKSLPSPNAQQSREHDDPDEGVRPLPWFLVMFLGAMAMWGSFYIYSTPSGGQSAFGDQRTITSLRPKQELAGAEIRIDGRQLYGAKCASCHQANGQGVPGVFPPLAESEWVIGSEKVLINILLHGVVGPIEVKGQMYQGAMPAWGAMTNAELAAISNYIRSDWGNDATSIGSQLIEAQREATKARSTPYNGGQELGPAS